MITKLKQIWNALDSATPRWARRIGNAMLGAGVTVSGISAFMDHHAIAISAGIAAAVGKFLTEFFHEEARNDNQKPLG